MASLQECETDGDPRRTALVATGVETIIDIVKSDADDAARAEGYQMPPPVEHATSDGRPRGEHNHHWDNHLFP
jgi:hypothetical protein